MASTLRVAALVAMVAAMACVVVARPVQAVDSDGAECGRQAADAVCLSNMCCSKDGMCGGGDEYCGGGCQSGPCRSAVEMKTTTTTAECGKQAYDAMCWPPTQCCSAEGMCGTGDAFCGSGCQSGRCRSAAEMKTTTTTPECGKQAYDAMCWPPTQCCSAEGMCGTGDAFCGSGCQSGDCHRSVLNNMY